MGEGRRKGGFKDNVANRDVTRRHVRRRCSTRILRIVHRLWVPLRTPEMPFRPNNVC